MHQDTRIGLVALGIGLPVLAAARIAGASLAGELYLAAGILVGVGSCLGLAYWRRRREERRDQLEEIREIATSLDYSDTDFTTNPAFPDAWERPDAPRQTGPSHLDRGRRTDR
ncbi:MAG: hypothetical protein ABEK12_01455 [Candidatus Nanohaloarchaea archaeon]